MNTARPLPLPALALCLALAACNDPPAPAPPPPSRTASQAATGAPRAVSIEWVAAPDGEVSDVVMREVERAKKDGRALLVYVGATWCEPCQRFHKASESGEIAGALPPLRMLEFDLDKDAERLAAAGYSSKLIPLFAAPGADGRGTDVRMEGSIKGSGAVANIVPRLRALLARAGGS